MKKKIKLYLNSECEVNCEYCLSKNKVKKEITEQEVIEYIKENIIEIETKEIELYGAEPTFEYSKEFILELSKIFKSVLLISTLANKEFVKELLEIKNVFFSVSYNKEIITKEILDFCKEKIKKFSFVITKKNLIELAETIFFLNKYDKKIKLLPEINYEKTYLYDQVELEKQFNLILSKDKMFLKIINFEFLLKHNYSMEEECLNSKISILPNGDLIACNYDNDLYYKKENKNVYNIKRNKLKEVSFKTKNIEIKKECLDCKLCKEFSCSNRIQPLNTNICQFNKTISKCFDNFEFKPELDKVTLFLTEQCNMKCKYCFEGEWKNRLGPCSEELIRKSFELLYRSNQEEAKELILFGGEPTLNKKGFAYLIELIKEKKPKDLKININTNLLVLDNELMEYFKQLSYYTSLYISVSLDGDEESNDLNRIDCSGKGTYKRIIENSKILRKYINENKLKIKLNKHTVLAKNNVNKMEEIIKESKLQSEIFNKISICPTTSCKGITEEYTKEDFKFIQSKIDSEKYPKEKISISFFNYKIFYDFKIEKKKLKTCEAGAKQVGIRSNGDIIPCHAFLDRIDEPKFNENFILGNLLTKEYTINSKNYLFLYWIKEYTLNNGLLKIESETGENCFDCKLNGKLCNVCLANSFVYKNKIIKTKEQCNRMKILTELNEEFYKTKFELELEKIKLENSELVKQISTGIELLIELNKENDKKLSLLLGDKNGK